MSSKVYVVSNGGHDYSDAARFGEVVFCTDQLIRKDDIAQMYRVLSDALKNAGASDYLLVGSLTSLCVVASAILADRFGEVHLLVYENGKYIPRDLILESQQQYTTEQLDDTVSTN